MSASYWLLVTMVQYSNDVVYVASMARTILTSGGGHVCVTGDAVSYYRFMYCSCVYDADECDYFRLLSHTTFIMSSFYCHK